jgi:hypothetical protein
VRERETTRVLLRTTSDVVKRREEETPVMEMLVEEVNTPCEMPLRPPVRLIPGESHLRKVKMCRGFFGLNLIEDTSGSHDRLGREARKSQ